MIVKNVMRAQKIDLRMSRRDDQMNEYNTPFFIINGFYFELFKIIQKNFNPSTIDVYTQ